MVFVGDREGSQCGSGSWSVCRDSYTDCEERIKQTVERSVVEQMPSMEIMDAGAAWAAAHGKKSSFHMAIDVTTWGDVAGFADQTPH